MGSVRIDWVTRTRGIIAIVTTCGRFDRSGRGGRQFGIFGGTDFICVRQRDAIRKQKRKEIGFIGKVGKVRGRGSRGYKDTGMALWAYIRYIHDR